MYIGMMLVLGHPIEAANLINPWPKSSLVRLAAISPAMRVHAKARNRIYYHWDDDSSTIVEPGCYLVNQAA